jgi:hypothetical protein
MILAHHIMKIRFPCFLCLLCFPLLLLLFLSPSLAMAGEHEARGAARREADEREEKRQLKSLWQQLSHEEREALRQQMREAWRRLTPEERQRAVAAAKRAKETREALANQDEKQYGMRGDDGKGRAYREDRKVEHQAYWDSLSVDERAALRENLRANLRAMRLRHCASPSEQEHGGRGGKSCGKAADH